MQMHRRSSSDERPLLVVSVDLCCAEAAAGRELVGQFASMFAAARLPVCWGLLAEAPAALRQSVAQVGGDVLRVAAGSLHLQRRDAVARWLRADGAPAAVVAVAGAQADSVLVHWDLLVKHGVRAVRTLGCAPLARDRQAARPRAVLPRPEAIRFGLWQVPVTISLPADDPAAVRGYLRRLGPGDYLHVHLDAVQLAASRQARRRCEAEVRRLAVGQQRGELRAVTMAALLERLCANTQARPSRSILRAA